MSRLAFDLVCSERDRLATLLEARMRIDRAEAGLPETPRAPKKADRMPATLKDKILRFSSVQVQNDLIARAYARHTQDGRSWRDVEVEFDAGMHAGNDMEAEA